MHPDYCTSHLHLAVQGPPDSEGPVRSGLLTEGGTSYLVENGDGLRSFCQNPEPASALGLPSTVKFKKRRVRVHPWCLFRGRRRQSRTCIHHMMDKSFQQILGFPYERDKQQW